MFASSSGVLDDDNIVGAVGDVSPDTVGDAAVMNKEFDNCFVVNLCVKGDDTLLISLFLILVSPVAVLSTLGIYHGFGH